MKPVIVRELFLSADPFVIACGKKALQVDFGQSGDGIFMSGRQLAEEMHFVPGMKFGEPSICRIETVRKKQVLILGVDGFIGNHLSERLLNSGKYEVHGMDLRINFDSKAAGSVRVPFFRR